MIYTLTLNPSLDYAIFLDDFRQGETNRSQREYISIGGKGVNVSILLKNLGVQSTAMGFLAGFTGQYIKEQLDCMCIKNDFIFVEGISRINVKLKTKQESEINANGPNINQDDISELIRKISLLKEDDVLIISGSVSKSVKSNIYFDILQSLSEKNIKLIVDTTGKALIDILKFRPFLIKPNKAELEEIFEIKISTNDQVLHYAKKLIDMGALNVIVSMGKDGAIFVNDNKSIYLKAPKGILKNSVGAGDSMVAGYVYGVINKEDEEKSFKIAIACGSATAFSDTLATKSEVQKLLNNM